MNTLWMKALVRVVAFLLAASIGGLIFSEIERRPQNEAEVNAKLLEALKSDMENRYNMTQEEFDNFTQLAYNALSPAGPAWSYFNGLRFAFETLTTIGYGSLSPATSLGQAICIVFAVLGIPIMILAFQSVGELISQGISSLIKIIEKKCIKREPCNVEAKCTVVTVILMVLMLLVGAAFQAAIDEWTFFEGFYFWFITFTTIGYGDYLPGYKKPAQNGENKNHHSYITTAAYTASVAFQLTWTTLGLCVVSSVLNALAAFIEKRRPCRMCTSGCLDSGQQEGNEDDIDANCDNSNEVKDKERPDHMTYV